MSGPDQIKQSANVRGAANESQLGGAFKGFAQASKQLALALVGSIKRSPAAKASPQPASTRSKTMAVAAHAHTGAAKSTQDANLAKAWMERECAAILNKLGDHKDGILSLEQLKMVAESLHRSLELPEGIAAIEQGLSFIQHDELKKEFQENIAFFSKMMLDSNGNAKLSPTQAAFLQGYVKFLQTLLMGNKDAGGQLQELSKLLDTTVQH
ncbi:MAG TPA: hypothetical protein VFV57_04310, partial [Limnobacter sp.]|nr:hypothetical protein [Limnobacter sp.]